MTELAVKRAEFVQDLITSGALTSQPWTDAFAAVPREEFVPSFYASSPTVPGWTPVTAQDDGWLDAVYSRAALVTQVGGAPVDSVPVVGVPTSSSSAPTLMARMLEALDVHDGHRVLEVGAGTGYNAALLAHRLGPQHVTSMDIDPGLVASARERLRRCGISPVVIAGDGLLGCPDRAPFDRIIATVAVDHVPSTWIDQVVAGGKILVPLDRGGNGGLLGLLDVHEDAAQGRFLPDYGGFMPVRANSRSAEWTIPMLEDEPCRSTAVSSDDATDADKPFEFFVALMLGGLSRIDFLPDDGADAETWISGPDGSWACLITAAEGVTVRQRGRRQLWDEIESLHEDWLRMGRPSRERFGLTVHGDRQVVWLDEPGTPHEWPLLASYRPAQSS